MLNKRSLFLAALLITILWITSPDRAYSAQPLLPVLAQAAPAAPLGSGFTYQGLLKDSNGVPINGTCTFQFTLWSELSGGSQIGGASTAAGVSVTNGYFSALVNASGEFGVRPFNDTTARYLQAAVKCESEPSYTGLSPRQAVTYTPPTHDHWGQTWTGSGSANALQLSGGTGGLWASGPQYGVYGQASSTDGRGLYGLASSATGPAYGVYGLTSSESGYGVYGLALNTTGFNVGVYGESISTWGYGLIGYATASTGQNYGLWARTNSSEGYGVYAYNSATEGGPVAVYGETAKGIGVYGHSDDTTPRRGNVGVVGESEGGLGVRGIGQVGGVWGSASGVDNVVGVAGLATAPTGQTYGVYGDSESTSGIGVYGLANNSAGYNVGVFGKSYSTVGAGVVGYTPASTGITTGVLGISDSTDGYGVHGYATATSGFNIGVYGKTNSEREGYAGLFEGYVEVTGYLYKSGGGFRIDHPLDPANQYLNHSFVESPDMMNIYNGIGTLDASGQAWVQLPAWFETLNQDFRYQLTPIGASMPDLFIASGVQGNRFQIGGGLPGGLVSWQVTGVRHDPWAEAHRLQVEQPKPSNEKGTYLHPELYGQPPELGLTYQLAPPPPAQLLAPPQPPELPAFDLDLDFLPVPGLTPPPALIPLQTAVPE